MSYFCYLICSNATFLKEEYIQLMIEWRFTRGVQPQTEKFMEGFGEVIPIEWLQYFDEAELEMILCGVQNIDNSSPPSIFHVAINFNDFTANKKIVIAIKIVACKKKRKATPKSRVW